VAEVVRFELRYPFEMKPSRLTGRTWIEAEATLLRQFALELPPRKYAALSDIRYFASAEREAPSNMRRSSDRQADAIF
jgi:hypothetical protein